MLCFYNRTTKATKGSSTSMIYLICRDQLQVTATGHVHYNHPAEIAYKHSPALLSEDTWHCSRKNKHFCFLYNNVVVLISCPSHNDALAILATKRVTEVNTTSYTVQTFHTRKSIRLFGSRFLRLWTSSDWSDPY